MAKYTSKDFQTLVNNIKGKDVIVLKATKNTIDRSATFSVNTAIKLITDEVNLSRQYLKSGINYVKRPSNNDLTAVVRANVRATLLERYPHSVYGGKGLGKGSVGGGTVSVNKGKSTFIKGLRYVTLKGSGERVIGLSNIDALKHFRANLYKGKGATPLKVKKLQQINLRAKNNPYGRTPLHSRSINQLFESARVDLQPDLKQFMQDNFLKEFNRLNK